jgi:SAM-dependent MidA family methyltransferase
MDSLSLVIKEKIRREGPITFNSFMRTALYHPGLGYYASADTEIGRAGDFYTSPHLHPVFGVMMGRQMQECWRIMGKPPLFDVMEFGGGRGYLCKDMLKYLKDREIFGSLRYTILEQNPHMVGRQKSLLEEFSGKINWAAPEEVKGRKGCVLSNELLDAFPVHLIEMQEELKEVYVTVRGDEFAETTGPLSTEAIADYLGEHSSTAFPPGYRTEVNLEIRDWLKDVARMLSEGFVITVDYGYPAREYYGEERSRGTLMCYHRHRTSEDPYENVGGQDITAHVNFSSLKSWGEEFSFTTLGFSGQGIFLVSLGIDEVITELFGGSPDYLREVSGIKGLIMPGSMGETHNVMVQYRGGGRPDLRGFLMKNRLSSL